MRKILVSLSFVAVFVLVMGIIASAEGLTELDKQQLEQKVNEVAGSLSQSTQVFIKDFAEKRNVRAENINNITEVDFEDLPKEVNIENVNDNNLAIYQVDYNESSQNNESKKLFVITYSVDKLGKQGDIIIAQDNRNFLDFGYSGNTSSNFLKTSAGVETSLEKGYVMSREGSITSISTNLEINGDASGEVIIIIYKNGEQVSFGNSIDASSGVKKDYDVQSKGVVIFQPGDVISAYVQVPSGEASDVTTLVEITTTN